MNNVEITVKFTNDEGKEFEYTFSYDKMQIQQDRGLMRIRSMGGDDIVPNGQERIMIRAWSGCKDFNDFKQEE